VPEVEFTFLSKKVASCFIVFFKALVAEGDAEVVDVCRTLLALRAGVDLFGVREREPFCKAVMESEERVVAVSVSDFGNFTRVLVVSESAGG